MESAIGESQELETVKQETDQMIMQANMLASSIVDAASYKKAGEFWLKAKALEKRIKAYFEPMKKAAKAVHTEICNKEAEALKRANESTAILSPAMGRYEADQERIRLEKERVAQAEARRLEEEARLNEAIQVQETGDSELAEQILATPAPVAPISIPKDRFESEAGGISTREQWSGEVVNLRELIKGILDGLVPITAVEANATVINQAARTNKDQMKWPGVRFFKTVIRVGRTA
jgi:hypothetical protein